MAAQRQVLLELGVAEDRIYTDHGITGYQPRTTRPRPSPRRRASEGDTLVVPKLDRLARSVPDARAIAHQLQQRGVKLALGPTLYDPNDPMGKMFFNLDFTQNSKRAMDVRTLGQHGVRQEPEGF